MKAGKYYIGDLCYVISDRWSEVMYAIASGDEESSGEFTLESGEEFAMFSTMYGDGTYLDNFDNEYAVDSSSIGCISIRYLSPKTVSDIKESNLGVIHEFTEDFEVSTHRGKLTFGDVVIDTLQDKDDVDNTESDW